jgi:ubiquitin C-terminal hydrolase
MEDPLSQKIRRLMTNIQDPSYVTQQIESLSGLDVVKKNGLTGLDNIGNTCYMNSVIQCLRHTTPLNNYLLTQATSKTIAKNFDENKGTCKATIMLVNYIKVANIMWTHDRSRVSPISFKVLLGINFDSFANNSQHDAHELLISFLQSFHDTVARNVTYRITGEIITDIDSHIKKAHDDWISYYKNKHSIILDIFSGQLRTELTCLSCEKVSFTFDPIMVIDLPIVSDAPLNICLDAFTKSEQFSEDNLVECGHCKQRTRAYKKNTLWKLPEILIIKFNRFTYEFNGGVYSSKKNNCRITYPMKGFDAIKYTSSPLITKSSYDLYAIICHMGTMNTGHYYAVCFNEVINSWVRYDDGNVSLLTELSEAIIQHTYILMYRRS